MNKERYQKYILKQRELNKDKLCKFCKKQHDHTFGTGEFCSIECRAKYAAQKSKVSQKSIAHRRELVENGILRKKNVFLDVDLINLRDRGDVVSPRLLKYGV